MVSFISEVCSVVFILLACAVTVVGTSDVISDVALLKDSDVVMAEVCEVASGVVSLEVTLEVICVEVCGVISEVVLVDTSEVEEDVPMLVIA